MLDEISVGEAGRAYLRQALRSCAGVAGYLDAILGDGGTIYAPLPRGTSPERAAEFETGGVSSLEKTLRWWVNDLAGKREGTLTVQDLWMERADFETRKPRIKTYFTDDTSAYLYLTAPAISGASLAALHREIRSFQFVAFYSEAVLQLSFEQRRHHKITRDQLSFLAEQAVAIYVSAYDQESLVVWESRTPRERTLGG